MLRRYLVALFAVVAFAILPFADGNEPLPRKAAAQAVVAKSSTATVSEEPSFSRKEDVIYGRKYGTALTMDVFTPKKDANGAAIVFVVSGGFFSSHEAINPAFALPLLGRGYTVFAVVHGSQPRYTVPEIVQDLHRAVRFIRYQAHDYGIDPDRIGIAGSSAGGHLALMMATAVSIALSRSAVPQ